MNIVHLEILKPLSPIVHFQTPLKKRSLKMFWEVALAEGKIHGKEPLDVGFHEVGAVDSIVDIVGAAICLEALKVDKIIASKIEPGGGFSNVNMVHCPSLLRQP